MTAATVIINCVCSVLGVALTMFTIGARFLKNNVTKEDLVAQIGPIRDEISTVNAKIDGITEEQGNMRERMAVVEYRLGLDNRMGT